MPQPDGLLARFAEALAAFDTIAHAAASLGQTNVWGHKMFARLCDELNVPTSRAEDLAIDPSPWEDNVWIELDMNFDLLLDALRDEGAEVERFAIDENGVRHHIAND